MPDVSPGEQAVLRLRWFVYDISARPVVVASVLIVLAVLAAMASALVGASTDLAGGFRNWVFFAQFGFTTEVELGVLIAAVLLVIDSRTAQRFRGQKSLFGVLTALGTAGVVVNVGAIVVYLTDTGVSALPFGTTAETWTEIITALLSPAVVASTATLTALRGTSVNPNPDGRP